MPFHREMLRCPHSSFLAVRSLVARLAVKLAPSRLKVASKLWSSKRNVSLVLFTLPPQCPTAVAATRVQTTTGTDPAAQKLKLLHKDNFIIIVESNPKFFNLLPKTKDGKFICWWGLPQKPSGETQNTECGYCMHAYNSLVRPRKITLKAWKGQPAGQ